jgi:hypothetical protein
LKDEKDFVGFSAACDEAHVLKQTPLFLSADYADFAD